jgi:cytochrome b pre-mRNA-processing protein 3
MRVFLKIFGALGYGSSRQVAARRALALYQQLCASREEEDREFWAKGAPPLVSLQLNEGSNK